jgi:hypothetical protein
MIAILYPTIALVALVFVAWATMFVARFRLLKSNPPTADTFRSGSAARAYFEPAELPANNFANLFEMPVLYFGLIPLLLFTGQAGHAQTGLAWAYVAMRALHSFLHIVVRKVIPRFQAYLVSCILLSAMWVGFAVDMVKLAPLV